MNQDADIFATVTIYAYGVAALFGILFMFALLKTDWFRHAWGRNVMAFMACLVPLEMFAFSRRYFGDWPGQRWVIMSLSAAIAFVTAWRWWLQVSGNRRQRAEARREAIRQLVRGKTEKEGSS